MHYFRNDGLTFLFTEYHWVVLAKNIDSCTLLLQVGWINQLNSTQWDSRQQTSVSQCFSGSTDVAEANVADPPPTKKRKLFTNCGGESHNWTSHEDSTIAEVLAQYLADGSETHSGCLSEFWHANQALYRKLIPAVLRAFAVPAWSASWSTFSVTVAFFWSQTEQECPTNYFQPLCSWSVIVCSWLTQTDIYAA